MVHNYSVPLHWRNIKQRYNLVGNQCTVCNEVYFPPRKICKNCRRKGDLKEKKLNGKGNIYSYTVIRNPPEAMSRMAPYIIAIVKMDEGPKIAAHIVGTSPEKINIGDRVELCFRKVHEAGESGLIKYGYKFRVK